MAEKSWPWTNNATGDGTSGGYTALEWGELNRYMLQGGGEASQGVLKGVMNELACSGTATPIAVNTGAAVVYGKLYHNTASNNLSVTTPVVGTTGGHVILRLDWTNQTVRLVAVRNTDGVNSTPSLTQSTSTQWEIRLATFTVTTGGVITLTDARAYAHFSQRVAYTNIDGLTAGGLLFGGATGLGTQDATKLYWDDTNNRLAIGTTSPSVDLDVQAASATARVLATSGAGGPSLFLQNNAGSPTYLGALGFVDSGGTVRGQVAYEVAGAALVFSAAAAERARLTATGLGIGVASPGYALDVAGQGRISPGSALPPLVLGANAQGQRVAGLVAEPVGTLGLKRQGGDASDWTIQGTSTQTLSTTDGMRMEIGTVRWSGSAATSGTLAVTFPTAFANKPIVFCQQGVSGASDYFVQPGSITANGFTINWKTVSGLNSATTIDFMYLAIGPQ